MTKNTVSGYLNKFFKTNVFFQELITTIYIGFLGLVFSSFVIYLVPVPIKLFFFLTDAAAKKLEIVGPINKLHRQ
jgi:hypothetical protein